MTRRTHPCQCFQPQKYHPLLLGTDSFIINVYGLHEIEGLIPLPGSNAVAEPAIAVPEPAVAEPVEASRAPLNLRSLKLRSPSLSRGPLPLRSIEGPSSAVRLFSMWNRETWSWLGTVGEILQNERMPTCLRVAWEAGYLA